MPLYNPTGGLPGGSANQIQYNSASTFAGMSGTAWDDTNRALTITGATITANHPMTNYTQTWNAAGVTFQADLINITNTASAGASTLIDRQVGGVSKFAVGTNGNITIPGALIYSNLSGNISLSVGSGYAYIWYQNGSGAPQFGVNSTGVYVFGVPLSIGAAFGGTADVLLYRDAANTLALRNAANAQVLNTYFSYTDGSNYTRSALKPTSGVHTWVGESAGTGDANIDLRVYPKGTGGFGYATEFDVERYWREARMLRLAPLTQELALNHLAVYGLGLPRSF